MTADDCPDCAGRGCLRASNDWSKCATCHGSGAKPTRAPDEILTSSGRLSRGEHWCYPPAKPKPALNVVDTPRTSSSTPKRDPRVCVACDGEGFWMAPVYHNGRVRERCYTCGGTGWIK